MTLSHQFFSTQTQLPIDSLDFFDKSTTQLLVNQWLGLVVWDSRDTTEKKNIAQDKRSLQHYKTSRRLLRVAGKPRYVRISRHTTGGGVLRPGSSTTQLGAIEDVSLHAHRIHVW